MSAIAPAPRPVRSDQRYTRQRPCPICCGHADMPQGKGVRCWGFTSADGEYAHCTREQFAGQLAPGADGSFAHRLRGPCTCGVAHGPEPPARSAAARRLPPVTTRYELHDTTGQLVGVHVRQDFLDTKGHPYRDKKFWWEQHQGRGAREMPLYRLADHVVAPRAALRIICEGEKAADALRAALSQARRLDEMIALGTVTGADACPCDDSLRPLVGYPVAFWPDHHDKGRQHMERIAARLVALGARAPQWMHWPDAPPKGDAADYFLAGGTVDALPQLVRAAPPASAPAVQQHHVGTLLADVVPETVRWLWPGRVPLGKLVVLDGDPGLGKSLVTLDLAARVSAGREMPDGSPSGLPPSGVVLLSAEDGLADTIRPRLDAAGADPTRIVALDAVTRAASGEEGAEPAPAPAPPMLPRDLPQLRSAVARVGARLVIIDPLMAFLGGEVDSHRDQDVRAALARLASLAEETGAAVVVVRHLNKLSGGNPL